MEFQREGWTEVRGQRRHFPENRRFAVTLPIIRQTIVTRSNDTAGEYFVAHLHCSSKAEVCALARHAADVADLCSPVICMLLKLTLQHTVQEVVLKPWGMAPPNCRASTRASRAARPCIPMKLKSRSSRSSVSDAHSSEHPLPMRCNIPTYHQLYRGGVGHWQRSALRHNCDRWVVTMELNATNVTYLHFYILTAPITRDDTHAHRFVAFSYLSLDPVFQRRVCNHK